MVKNIFWTDVLFPTNIVDLSTVGQEGVILPSGPSVARPATPVNGTIRYNTSLNIFEGYQNGAWTLFNTGASGGEANTSSNQGTGLGLALPKNGVDLPFKTLVQGSNIQLIPGPSTITINATAVGETNTGNNIGTGIGVYDSKVGPVLNFKSFRTLTPSTITIADSGVGDILINFVGALGESNTASNLAGGTANVYASKTGVNFNFRSLINLTPNAFALTQTANNINLGLANDAVFPGNGSITVPIGTTAQRPPAPTSGMLRFNSSLGGLEAYISGSWTILSTSSGIFLPLAGGNMTGNIVMNSGTQIQMSPSSQIQFGNNSSAVFQGNAGISMASSTGGITLSPGATVDGRDVSADGAIIDQMNTANGFVTRVSSGLFANRTLVGAANQISITNNTGFSGDPVIGLAANPVIPGTGAMTPPSGTTLQRPASPSAGSFRYNSSISKLEYYLAPNWRTLIDSAGGQITSGNLDFNNNGIINIATINGRNYNADGSVIDNLTAIPTDAGVIVKTGNSFTTRLITSSVGLDRLGIAIENGDGTQDIAIGLDLADIPQNVSLDPTMLFPFYDPNTFSNYTVTLDNLATFVGSISGNNLYLSKNGDTSLGDQHFSGGSIVMDNNRSSAVGIPNGLISDNSEFSIDAYIIDVNIGDDASTVASTINTNPDIINDGTIFADTIDNGSTLRIYKIGNIPMTLTELIGTPLSDMGIAPTTYSPIGLVDGRDVSADGVVVDAINMNGFYGYIVRAQDGDPSTFEYRNINSDVTPANLGIAIQNPDGVSDNTIVGLDIHNQTSVAPLADSDEFIVYSNAGTTNGKATSSDVLTYIRKNSNSSFCRTNVNGSTVVTGSSSINFSSGAKSLDNNNEFNLSTSTFTPAAGIYRITVHVTIDSFAAAGKYTFAILKNGTPTGPIITLTSNATDQFASSVSDLVQANGTDAFSVQVNNGTAGASQIASVVFMANREY